MRLICLKPINILAPSATESCRANVDRLTRRCRISCTLLAMTACWYMTAARNRICYGCKKCNIETEAVRGGTAWRQRLPAGADFVAI